MFHAPVSSELEGNNSPMLSVTNLKAGTIFEDQGNIFKVLSYEHTKVGRGSANIKVKVRNVRSGATLEKTFMNGAKVSDVSIATRELQFLYKDGESAYFMDPATFEQVSISLKTIEDHIYLKDGENFSLSFLADEPLSLNLPPKMEFVVSDTGPEFRGNSATNIYKDAVLENGLKTKVPLFIKIGDRVRIDTRSGAYTERA